MVFNVKCFRVLQSDGKGLKGVDPEDKECYNMGVMKGDLVSVF